MNMNPMNACPTHQNPTGQHNFFDILIKWIRPSIEWGKSIAKCGGHTKNEKIQIQRKNGAIVLRSAAPRDGQVQVHVAATREINLATGY